MSFVTRIDSYDHSTNCPDKALEWLSMRLVVTGSATLSYKIKGRTEKNSVSADELSKLRNRGAKFICTDHQIHRVAIDRTNFNSPSARLSNRVASSRSRRKQDILNSMVEMPARFEFLRRQGLEDKLVIPEIKDISLGKPTNPGGAKVKKFLKNFKGETPTIKVKHSISDLTKRSHDILLPRHKLVPDEYLKVHYLFHGTNPSNYRSILRGGFRLDRIAHGRLLGNGVYVGGMKKASWYSFEPLILKVAVILGKCLDVTGRSALMENVHVPPYLYDSIHLGAGDNSVAWGGMIRNEEWCIADPRMIEVVEIVPSSRIL
jgi:hypothetical protein